MYKKSLLTALVAFACAGAQAADYYVVVPVKNKTANISAITMSLMASTLPAAIVGSPYGPVNLKDYLQVIGDPAYNGGGIGWQITGALPPGVSLASGALAGTVTQAGNYAFSVTASYKTKSAAQTYGIAATIPFGVPAKLSYGLATPGTTWTNTNGTTGKYGVFSDVGITHGKWFLEIVLDDNYSATYYPLYEIGISNNPVSSSSIAWFAESQVSTAMGAYVYPTSKYFCSSRTVRPI